VFAVAGFGYLLAVSRLRILRLPALKRNSMRVVLAASLGGVWRGERLLIVRFRTPPMIETDVWRSL